MSLDVDLSLRDSGAFGHCGRNSEKLTHDILLCTINPLSIYLEV